MTDEYSGGGGGRSLVVGDWKVALFDDGTVTPQTIFDGNLKIGGIISLTGVASVGSITLSDATNSYLFAAGSIPVGGQFFGGGMRMDNGIITLASAAERILVLYRESDYSIEMM